MKKRSPLGLLLVSSCFGALSACSDPPPPVAIVSSVADADSAAGAPDAGLGCPALAALDGRIGTTPSITGRCSYDESGRELSYQWRFVDLPSGSLATLHDASLPTPTFVPDVVGTYTVELVVEAGGQHSDPAQLAIDVDACGTRAPSIADIAALPGASPAVSQTVELVPDFSDADLAADCMAHDAAFAFDWQLLSMPSTSLAALSDAAAMTPWFTPDVPGDYVFGLVITDPTGLAGYAEITVTAGACGANAPSAIAAASATSTSVGGGVQLTVGVTDADLVSPCDMAQTMTYEWRFAAVPAGSMATITAATAAASSFTPDVPGDYVLEVVVTDSTGRSSTSQITVTADDCGLARPVALASKAAPSGVASCGGAPIAISLGGNKEVLLDGSASYDPDNDGAGCALSQRLDYRWELMATPLNGGGSRVRTPNGFSTVLEADSDGEYKVRLIVTDETGRESEPIMCTLDLTNVG